MTSTELEWVVWNALSCADGWTELDRSDVVEIKVIPALMRHRHDHADLWFAIQQAKGNSDYAPLLDLFDRAVQKYGGERSYNDWADQFSDYRP